MSKALGISDELITGELYVAWLKDTRERSTTESAKFFREIMEKVFRDKDVVLRSQRAGVNMAITLSSLLTRSHVTKLDLYENTIRDAGCEAVAHLMREAQSLTHVNLGGNDIGAVGITALASVVATHRRLQTLILGSNDGDPHVNRIDGTCAKTLLEACARSKTLKVIDLNRNPLGKTSQDCFGVLANLIASSTTLQVVKVASTEMSTESAVNVVLAASRASSLSYLDFHGNNLSHAVGEAVGKLLTEKGSRSAVHSLKTIMLQQNPRIGGRGTIPIFRPLALDKSLSTLDVSGCSVDDEALSHLCMSLASNTSMTYLDLSKNFITDEGVVELARALLRHPAMGTLALSHNKVRDEGACALAAMLENNTVMDRLDLEEAWISDRGVIALGVALASNQTLTSLRLANNHISDDGGTAFAALIDKNKSLQACSIRGNSIYHSTALQAAKVTNRNKQAKQDEVPNKLRKEVIKLHYQLYKLEEAKLELDAQRKQKAEIERLQERNEAQFREEEADYRKRRKELGDQIRDHEAQTKDLEAFIQQIGEQFERDSQKHDVDLKNLEAKLETETAEREKAEEDLRAVQAELEALENGRQTRVADLKKQIQDTKEDREKWIQQAAEYKERAAPVQQRLQELEHSASAAAEAAMKAREEKEKEKEAKKGKGKGGDKAADIAALLNQS